MTSVSSQSNAEQEFESDKNKIQWLESRLQLAIAAYDSRYNSASMISDCSFTQCPEMEQLREDLAQLRRISVQKFRKEDIKQEDVSSRTEEIDINMANWLKSWKGQNRKVSFRYVKHKLGPN